MSKKDGRKVASVLKANGSLTDKGLDAVWSLVNKHNKEVAKKDAHICTLKDLAFCGGCKKSNVN